MLTSLDCYDADLLRSVHYSGPGVTLSALIDQENAQVTGTGMYCTVAREAASGPG